MRFFIGRPCVKILLYLYITVVLKIETCYNFKNYFEIVANLTISKKLKTRINTIHSLQYCYNVCNAKSNFNLQQNCLRALVIKLFEKKERRKLVQFAYGDMQQDFVEILEERARSCEVPLVQPTQYDLLYAFHVYRNNYRKGTLICFLKFQRNKFFVKIFRHLLKKKENWLFLFS